MNIPKLAVLPNRPQSMRGLPRQRGTRLKHKGTKKTFVKLSMRYELRRCGRLSLKGCDSLERGINFMEQQLKKFSLFLAMVGTTALVGGCAATRPPSLDR